MAGSTYSSNLKIELMTTGENSGTWGDVTNTNLGTALEQAVVGYGNPDYVSDANLTISITNSNAAQAARALVLNVTSVFGSLTQTRELVVPTIQKQYIVQNNTTGGQSITVKTSAGTGITVPNGRKAHLYVDGTNVIQMFDFVDINGGSIDGTPIGASSASTGAFTTLNASGATTLDGNVTLGNASGDTVTVTGTIASNLLFTDNTYDIGASGATRPRNLYLAGAATIGGNLSVGGTLTLTGGLTLNGNVTVGDSASDTLTINSTVTSNLIFTDNTYDIGASGATRPRNLFMAGNATIGGNQTLTGALTVDSTTDSSSTTTGSIQTDGGLGVAKAAYIGSTLNVAGAVTGGGTITGTQATTNFIAYTPSSSSYASYRLYNDQNSGSRSLEIDYSGSAYSGAVLTGGPTGEQGTIGTTGAYPLTLGTSNTARMFFSGTGLAVGIGRTPTSIFDVYGATPIVTVAASDNNSRAYLSTTAKTSGGTAVTTCVGSFGDGSQGSLYTATNHALTFSTNNASAQMALTTGGNLAISAVTPYSYGGTPRLYIDSATQNAASITLNQLNTTGGYNGQLLWQGYYNGTTTTHDSMAIKRYNGVDANDSTYRVYMDFMLRPPGVGQSLATAVRLTNINNGCLSIGTDGNTYDNNLYVYKSVSNIVNGAQENNAVAAFGNTTSVGDAFVCIGADQGTNKYGYIASVSRSLGYNPLLLNPAGGNVGIGTGVSMPGYNLDVWASSPGVRIKATSSAGGAQLILDCGGTSGYSNQIQFQNSATSYWALGGKDIGSASGNQFSLYNYTTASNAFTIQNSTNLTSINSASAGAMLYVNTAGYALTSGQSGAFLLVASTGSGRPCIEVASSSSGQDAAYRTVVTNGSTWSGWTVGMNIETGSDIMSWCYNSTQGDRIYSVSGTVGMRLSTGGALSTTTGSLGTISDIRMKKNVADATNKLDQLMQLRVVNYTLIDDPQERKMLGFVAQEVEQVFPGLVEEYDVRDPETKEITMMQKTVKTTVLIPMLVKAMQELKAEFDAYKVSHP